MVSARYLMGNLLAYEIRATNSVHKQARQDEATVWEGIAPLMVLFSR